MLLILLYFFIIAIYYGKYLNNLFISMYLRIKYLYKYVETPK